jgi:hypothetical protein
MRSIEWPTVMVVALAGASDDIGFGGLNGFGAKGVARGLVDCCSMSQEVLFPRGASEFREEFKPVNNDTRGGIKKINKILAKLSSFVNYDFSVKFRQLLFFSSSFVNYDFFRQVSSIEIFFVKFRQLRFFSSSFVNYDCFVKFRQL